MKLSVHPTCCFLWLISPHRAPRRQTMEVRADVCTDVKICRAQEIRTEASKVEPQRDHVTQAHQVLKALQKVHRRVVPPLRHVQVWTRLVSAVRWRLEHKETVPGCDDHGEHAADLHRVVVLQQLCLLAGTQVEV